MSAEALAQAGGVVGASGVALLLVSGQRSVRLLGLGAFALGLGLFLPLFAPEERRGILLVGGVLGLAAAAGLAALLLRRPWALAFLTLAAAPARIPVTVGDTTANLLLPLYVLVAAAAFALGWTLWRKGGASREFGPLAWPAALLVFWFGLSGLWTRDVRNGAVELFFYILPFSVLAIVLARLRWPIRGVSPLGVLQVVMAAVFAAVGIWQWTTHGVFWNQKVIAANANDTFYRVNSLFWDPSIYGRFLVLGILVALAGLLFGPPRRTRVELALVLAIVLVSVGLFLSYSQSSFVALGAGVLTAAAIAWRWRALLALAAAVAVLVPVAFALPQFDDFQDRVSRSSQSGLTRITSHRSQLVSGGIRIVRDHPLVGVGVGAFGKAYEEEVGELTRRRTAASHTTPVTVAAQTGLVGLTLYVWLLVSALWLAFRRLDLSTAAGRAQVVAGTCFVAIVVHSLFYSAFFEDPLTWGLVALTLVAARARGLVTREDA